MPDNQPALDISIYGGVRGSIEPTGPATSTPYAAPKPVAATSVVQGSALLAEGAMNLRANQRLKANALESAGAAMTQWSGVHAFEWLTMPNETPDPAFNAAKAIEAVPFQLGEDDIEFVMKAKSAEGFNRRVSNLKERNDAAQAMGDNPFVSFIAQSLDPAYLAIDAASAGAARFARLGRMGAGAMAGAATAGLMVVESQVTPVSTTEIVLGSMLMAGISSAVYHEGRLVKNDPAFPDRQLREAAQPIQTRLDEAAEQVAVKREVQLVRAADESPVRVAGQGEKLDVPHIKSSGKAMLSTIERGDDALLAVMAKRVNELMLDDVEVRTVSKKSDLPGGGAAEAYDPSTHTVYVHAGTSPAVQLHELTHALTVHKIKYGIENPTSAHGKIVREIETLRQAASEAHSFNGGDLTDMKNVSSYLLQSPTEFVAGVFTGKTEFLDLLASVKLPAGGTVLSKLVDGVRRILGMAPSDENALLRTIGLTEDLSKNPLKVTLVKAGEGVAAAMQLHMAPPVGASTAQTIKSLAKHKEFGKLVEWSWHKSFSKYSPKSAEIADMLMDSALNPRGNSAESIKRSLRADLSSFQYKYEDALLEAMSARGAGLAARVFRTGKAVGVQQGIEREVYAEMMRRNRAALDGTNILPHSDPSIVKMADALDATSKRALQEMQAAGVTGADVVSESAGYVTRRWDIAKMEGVERKLLDGGATPQAARQSIVDTLSIGIQRANGWDAELAQDVAGAIYDRTKRKGMFQDSEFTAGVGEDGAAKLRSLLNAEGLQGPRLDRVMDVLAGKTDAAGKLNTLKNRVDMHLDETVALPDGTTASILDMLDTNVAAITDRYLDTIAARSALARKGLPDPSDIKNLRNSLAQSIENVGQRGEAIESFDQMMNVLMGNPVGEDMLSAVRAASTASQMVGLAKSGLWQLTEYSTIMAQYGAVATVKSMLKELPFIKNMVTQETESLRNVLARNSAQDTRLRPFINRMEDNFEIPMSDSLKLALQQGKQLVPYANAMKWIQKHQARTSANLIVDTIVRAAKGDAKAATALESYGLESHIMVKVASDISTYGMDTSKWSHATWTEVRGPLTKMMDDAVLRARLGEVPQFAHTSTLGKFLFTFRSFTLAAHNKVLAGTLHNSGFGGIGLLLAYQFPMTVLATAAGTAAENKPSDDLAGTAAKAMGQLGALGLFTEVFGVAMGQKQQFGMPGFISVDRAYKLAGAIRSAATGEGSAGDVSAAAINATPIMSSFLPAKALGNALKDNKE
jgi:hypothetical protein